MFILSTCYLPVYTWSTYTKLCYLSPHQKVKTKHIQHFFVLVIKEYNLAIPANSVNEPFYHSLIYLCVCVCVTFSFSIQPKLRLKYSWPQSVTLLRQYCHQYSNNTHSCTQTILTSLTRQYSPQYSYSSVSCPKLPQIHQLVPSYQLCELVAWNLWMCCYLYFLKSLQY